MTPVVRYYLNGRTYEASVLNRSDAVEVGTHLDLLVDPGDPYQPIARYGGDSVFAFAIAVTGVALCIALITWSIALM